MGYVNVDREGKICGKDIQAEESCVSEIIINLLWAPFSIRPSLINVNMRLFNNSQEEGPFSE